MTRVWVLHYNSAVDLKNDVGGSLPIMFGMYIMFIIIILLVLYERGDPVFRHCKELPRGHKHLEGGFFAR